MNELPAPPMPAWLEAMVPFRRYRVRVGQWRMHVMECGEGLPVVMLHGNPSWGFLYRKVAEALSGEPLRLIMPDMIGLGFSDKPRDASVHTLDNHIDWIASLLDQLELERCVMVVQDWGGALGVGALARRPQLRAGLVVMNTVVSEPKKGFKPKPVHRFSHTPLLSDLLVRVLGIAKWGMPLTQGDRESISGAVWRAYRYPLRSLRDNAAPLALLRMAPSGFDHPSIAPLRECHEYVKQFDGPAAIVWGDNDPVLGSVRGWMEKLFPNATVTRTSAGHFLQEEVPVEIAAAVRDVASRLH